MSTVQPTAPAPKAVNTPQSANAPVQGQVTAGAAALQPGNQGRPGPQGPGQAQPPAPPTQQSTIQAAPTPASKSPPSSLPESTAAPSRTAAASAPTPQSQAQPQQSAAQDVTITRVRTDGSVSVRTAAGDATIAINPRQIPSFVRPGAVVSVSLQQTENGLQALLQPRSAAQANAPATQASGSPQSSTATTGSATSTTEPAARTLPPLSDGQIARAIVLRPTSLPQGIAGGPLPPSASSLQPQQAAQAAARYLFASSPHVTHSGSAPFAPQSAHSLTALLSQGPQPSAQPDTAAQGASQIARQPALPSQTATTLTPPGSSSQSPTGAVPQASPSSQIAGLTVTTGTASTTPGQSGLSVALGQTSVAAAAGQTANTGQSTGAVPITPSIPQGTSETRSNAAPTQSTIPLATSGNAAAATAPKPGTALPPGTDFPIRVLSVGQQTSNALSAQSGNGSTVISGTIVATGGSGQAIVNSSVGLLDIAARAEAGQLQAAIRMEIIGRTDSDVRGRAEGGGQTPLSTLSREWPALEESLRILEMAAPQSAAQIASTIARPGPQLTASMLFFLAAVRGGSVGGWLGKDAGQALEKTNSRLLSALSGDFQSMSRASEGGPETAGWRAFFMPVQTQDTLEQMRLFILPPSFEKAGEDGGEENEKQDNRGSDEETRFVVDLMLSGLGPFQIDGSVSKQSLSLLIRTRRALPQEMRAEIIEIFENAAGRTGMSGAVSFKVQREFPPLPIADLMPDGRQSPDLYA